MDPNLAQQAQAAIAESRFEMLLEAARLLLSWNRSVEEIMEATGLPRQEIDDLSSGKHSG